MTSKTNSKKTDIDLKDFNAAIESKKAANQKLSLFSEERNKHLAQKQAFEAEINQIEDRLNNGINKDLETAMDTENPIKTFDLLAKEEAELKVRLDFVRKAIKAIESHPILASGIQEELKSNVSAYTSSAYKKSYDALEQELLKAIPFVVQMFALYTKYDGHYASFYKGSLTEAGRNGFKEFMSRFFDEYQLSYAQENDLKTSDLYAGHFIKELAKQHPFIDQIESVK